MAGFPATYGDAEDCVPDNATIVNYAGLHVGGAGTVRVVTPTGSTVNFTAVAGEIIPIEVKQVLLTGTSATNIVGFKRG